MHITVVDTETTGFEGSIVEVAGVVVDTSSGRIEDYNHSLIMPRHPITYGAMAMHHITPEMVEDAPELETYLSSTFDLGLTNDTNDQKIIGLGAHNAAFDRAFFPERIRDREWICTWRCSEQLFPDAESHGNQALRYELGLDVDDMPQEAGGLPHRALYDAWVTAKLLLRMVEETDEDLFALTKKPILQTTIKFGKHRGEKWSEVPKSYLNWILGQDFDDDVKYTAEYYR